MISQCFLGVYLIHPPKFCAGLVENVPPSALLTDSDLFVNWRGQPAVLAALELRRGSEHPDSVRHYPQRHGRTDREKLGFLFSANFHPAIYVPGGQQCVIFTT